MGFRLSTTVLLVLSACASTAEAPSKSAPLRVGHTFTNGNCALDADHKLTGLCEGSGKSGCITHEPDPDSPACPIGLVVTETRTPVCSGTSQEVVSREHPCFFVDR